MLLSEDSSLRHKPQRDSLQDPLQTSRHVVTKKRRRLHHHSLPWYRCPDVWDSLSKVWLTPLALKEFDRRNLESKQRQAHTFSTVRDERRILTRSQSTFLRALASKGGLDLSHLRRSSNPGCNMGKRSLASKPKRSSTSNPKPSSTSSPNSSTTSDSTHPTKNVTPYDANYKQKMIDHGIYPHNQASKPNNREAILNKLAVERRSLSPSRFGEDDFERYKALRNSMDNETMMIRKVMSIIEGDGNEHFSSGDILFGRLKPLARKLSAAKPDMYDGAPPAQIDRRVRSDLRNRIVPSRKDTRPAAPNFFTEGKGEDGKDLVGQMQACYDGAIGARAMNSLQNYGQEIPIYDGNAYSFTNIYHGGTGLLEMYATHPTAPKAPGEKPEYHMTQLRSFAMTDSIETFRKGAAAYRNVRDLAGEQRNKFIDQANQVARRMHKQKNQTSSDLLGGATSKLAPSDSDSDSDSGSDSDSDLDSDSDEVRPVKRLRRSVSCHDDEDNDEDNGEDNGEDNDEDNDEGNEDDDSHEPQNNRSTWLTQTCSGQ